MLFLFLFLPLNSEFFSTKNSIRFLFRFYFSVELFTFHNSRVCMFRILNSLSLFLPSVFSHLLSPFFSSYFSFFTLGVCLCLIYIRALFWHCFPPTKTTTTTTVCYWVTQTGGNAHFFFVSFCFSWTIPKIRTKRKAKKREKRIFTFTLKYSVNSK